MLGNIVQNIRHNSQQVESCNGSKEQCAIIILCRHATWEMLYERETLNESSHLEKDYFYTTHCIIAFAFMLLVVLLSILRTIVEYTKESKETDNQNYTYYRSKSARTKRNKAKHEGYYNLHWPSSSLFWYSTFLCKRFILKAIYKSLI